MKKSLKKKQAIFINKLFSLIYGLLILSLFLFSFSLIINSSVVFNNYIFSLFNKIPVLGQLLYVYIKSLNIIDLSFLFNNVIKKALLIELLYYILIIIFFYCLNIFAFNKYKKHNNKILWLLISLSTIIALIITNPNPILLLENIYSVSFYKYKILVNTLLTTQLVIIIYLSVLNKTYIHFNAHLKNKIIKTTSSTLIVILLLFSSTLLLINSQSYTFKEIVKIDYTINFVRDDNDIVSIEVPDKLHEITEIIGINIPKAIDGNSMLSFLNLDNINIGKITSSYVLEIIDDLIYIFIKTPINTSLLNIALVIIIFIYHKKKSIIPFSKIITEVLQVLLSIILLISVNNYGITINLLGSIILIISLLDFSIEFNACKKSYDLRKTG